MLYKRTFRSVLLFVLPFSFFALSALKSVQIQADTRKGAQEMSYISAFSLDQVSITDEYIINAVNMELAYLLEFDVNKLLAGFRQTAGLDTKGARRYSGWEDSLIGGHTLGHYLTACSQAYAGAMVSQDNKKALYDKVTEIVDGLLECQKNTKGQKGFIFGAKLTDSGNVELQFDNVESGKTDIIREAWVPWYTMHKLIAGLVDTYNLTGYENAKTVAAGLGDWTYNRASGWSEALRKKVLGVEYGGMNDCLYDLYKITKDPKHAQAAHIFDETALFERVKAGSANVLNNYHANTTIPKFLGALNRYETLHGQSLSAEQTDASEYLAYAESFWQMVIDRHTYVTGGNSEWERFGQDNILDAERTNCNNETCNIYNMLKLSRKLFRITGDKKYADYYENAYINSILSSQNPATGMTSYFQPMATGYFKVYSSKFNHFWCCTGSGMENLTKLNDSIYFYKDSSLYVNMYISSELDFKQQNVTVIQNSDIPNSDKASFTIKSKSKKAVPLSLRFRIPDWSAGELKAELNGKELKTAAENGYLLVDAGFKDGDVVSISIPMEVKAYGLPDNGNVYAFKYGPLVLSAKLGKDSMTTTTTGMNVTIPAGKLPDNDTLILDEAAGTVENFIDNIDKYMKRAADKLEFTLTGVKQSMTFVPHYMQHTERYGIYWNYLSMEEYLKNEADKIRCDYQILDTIQPGYGQYENDELHDMTELNSLTSSSDIYRKAAKDGWFSYNMIIDPLKDNYLLLSFRKEDNGKTIQISVDETVIYSNTLRFDGEADSYPLSIRIPRDAVEQNRRLSVANGKDNWVIPVKFSGLNGAESARVCDLINTANILPRYIVGEKLAYFVDCGDHDVLTVSKGDAFGVYNSVTEQLYKEDEITGYKWGIVDDSKDKYNGSIISKAVYTANTWAYEFVKQDGLAKTETNRYTKNQLESGITPRFLDYAFELPNGRYKVEMGFADPWKCSDYPSAYLNIDKESKITVGERISIAATPVISKELEVTDGELTVNFRSDSAAINVTYIKITIIDDKREEKAKALEKELEEAKLAMTKAETEDADISHVKSELTDKESSDADALATASEISDRTVEEAGSKAGKTTAWLWLLVAAVITAIAGCLILLKKRGKVK